MTLVWDGTQFVDPPDIVPPEAPGGGGGGVSIPEGEAPPDDPEVGDLWLDTGSEGASGGGPILGEALAPWVFTEEHVAHDDSWWGASAVRFYSWTATADAEVTMQFPEGLTLDGWWDIYLWPGDTPNVTYPDSDAASGDFDGDELADLAVTRPTALVTIEEGEAYTLAVVFWDTPPEPLTFDLNAALAQFVPGGGLGVLPPGPDLLLTSDGLGGIVGSRTIGSVVTESILGTWTAAYQWTMPILGGGSLDLSDSLELVVENTIKPWVLSGGSASLGAEVSHDAWDEENPITTVGSDPTWAIELSQGAYMLTRRYSVEYRNETDAAAWIQFRTWMWIMGGLYPIQQPFANDVVTQEEYCPAGMVTIKTFELTDTLASIYPTGGGVLEHAVGGQVSGGGAGPGEAKVSLTKFVGTIWKVR